MIHHIAIIGSEVQQIREVNNIYGRDGKMLRKSRASCILLVLLVALLVSTVALAADGAKPVRGIKIAQPNMTLNVGETFTPDITINPPDATNKDYVLTSGDQSVVVVDGHKIRAVGGGKASVEVSPADGSKVKAKFQVYVPSLAGLIWDSYSMDSLRDLEIKLNYYGRREDLQVQVSAKNYINVTPSLQGTNLVLKVSALKPGKSRITVKDKTDNRSSMTTEVTVGSGAIPNARKITITQVNQNGRGVVVGVNNQTGGGIKYVYFAVTLYDESGNLLMPADRSTKKWDDFSKTVQIFDSGSTNRAMRTREGTGNITLYLNESLRSRRFSRIEVAVIGYEPAGQTDYSDADPIAFPESQWAWFSSKEKGYINTPSVTDNYRIPTYENRSVYSPYSELRSKLYFGGAHGYYLPKKYANAYGFKQSGIWITELSENWQKLYPIQVGDMLWGVDDLQYVDEPYLEEIFNNELYKDENTVTLHLARKGENYDVTVNRQDYYSSYNEEAFYFDAENRNLIPQEEEVSQTIDNIEETAAEKTTGNAGAESMGSAAEEAGDNVVESTDQAEHKEEGGEKTGEAAAKTEQHTQSNASYSSERFDLRAIRERFEKLQAENTEDLTVYVYDSTATAAKPNGELNDQNFLLDLAAGLQNRWMLSNNVPSNLNDEQIQRAYLKFVEAEQKQIDKYQEVQLEDPLLDFLAHAYILALGNQQQAISKYYGTTQYEVLWNEDGYNQRAVLIYLMNRFYQITVDPKYMETMTEFIIGGYLILPSDPVDNISQFVSKYMDESNKGR